MRRLLATPPFVTVWLVGFFNEVAFFLLLNLPGRFAELGVGEAGIGVAYAGSAVTALALRPWFGRILDHVHRRSVLRVAGIANILAVAALAFVEVAGPLLWTLFLLQRVTQILLFTTLLTYSADSLPVELRTQGLALFGLSGLIPLAITNLVGDVLLAQAGFRLVLLASAGAGLTSWLLTWRLPLLPVLGTRPRRSFWAVVGQRDLLPLWWITLMFAIGMETLFTFMRTYIDTRRIGSLGLFFGVYGAMAVITRLGGGSRYDRLPHRGVAVTAVVAQAAGLILVAVAGDLGPLLIGAGLAGAAHGVVFPILSSEVVNRSRTAERGSAVAAFTSVMDISLVTMAPAVGTIIDLASYAAAFASVGLVVAAGAGIYLIWDRRQLSLPVPVA